jgi:hypothetical protein
MYLFCNSRIHVITLYSGHVCLYYAPMLQCWHLIWILVMTNHPCLGVRCHTLHPPAPLLNPNTAPFSPSSTSEWLRFSPSSSEGSPSTPGRVSSICPVSSFVDVVRSKGKAPVEALGSGSGRSPWWPWSPLSTCCFLGGSLGRYGRRASRPPGLSCLAITPRGGPR